MYLGVCGDDCAVCPRYVATRSGDLAELNRVAELWKKAGYRDKILSPEEIACHGCATVKWCRYDDIRACAAAMGIGNCGECRNYPCEKILEVFERTESYAERCAAACSKEEYEQLEKTFFSKRARLNRIHREELNNK